MKILVIQTAFLGDVVLATALLEKLHACYPESKLDFLLRKGNESLLVEHPFIRQVLVLNKQEGKLKNQWKLLRHIRRERYDLVVNVHRYLSSGLLTAFSGAKKKVGFAKNPLSGLFSHAFPHHVAQAGEGTHEVARNQQLIAQFTDETPAHPALYPPPAAYEKIRAWQQHPYVCLAPTSVWFSKQLPAAQWEALIGQLPKHVRVYLLGAPSDAALCQGIAERARAGVESLAGQLSLLESAALMQGAQLNYVNDSAPLHLCSALSAPVCAVFCSTVPSFGFSPYTRGFARIVQTEEALSCRPCGLHGFPNCPQGHFRCAAGVTSTALLKAYQEATTTFS